MKAFYALNNFNKAIRILPRTEFGRRKWLCSRYVEHLCQLELTDMPSELRREFVQFRLDMTFIQADCKTGIPKMTVHVMTEAQIDEMVARILAMRDVCELLRLTEGESNRDLTQC